MVFAGIWASRLDPVTDVWHRTCSIITTEATGVVSEIHDRMPVIVPRAAWRSWIDRDLTDGEAALSTLSPVDPDEIMEHQVSSKVNSVKNNSPDLRDPSGPETLF
jgi:putative SOS response-associated peptidase YedK